MLTFLEQLPPIEALALSRWVYASVNASHILGIACLVGAIVAADFRIIGARRDGVWRTGLRQLLWVSRFGFVVAVATGAAMFATRATEYPFNPAFQIKMALLATALANIWLFHRVLARSALGGAEPVRPAARLSAGLSLVLWISVLFAGRMIAFVD